MNLENGTLEDWLKNPPADAKYKKGGDTYPFYSKYDNFKDYLNKNVHNETTKEAIIAEIQENKDFDKVTWLNDHGPEHIKTVIQRASLLVESKDCELNPREVFILLNSIQIHDVGNFFGRHNHEKKIIETIKDGLSPAVFDRKEVKLIKDIAQVHGGSYKEENGVKTKNTFKSIISPTSNSDSYVIRLHLLASILRFADELADDKNRADIKSLKEKKMPKGSEIYHAYALCLEPPIVNHEERRIELHYYINKEDLYSNFGKYDNESDTIIEKTVLEEIYERTLKIHYERIYCSKYWKKNIDIESIWVKIEFYSDLYEDIHPEITYTLTDSEYPNKDGLTIFDLCKKELSYPDGQLITTENVIKKIEENEKSI